MRWKQQVLYHDDEFIHFKFNNKNDKLDNRINTDILMNFPILSENQSKIHIKQKEFYDI